MFRYRDYRFLMGSTFFNSFAYWTEQVALGWLMLTLTDSPLMVGLAYASRMIPFFFLGIPAGVVADQVNRRLFLRVLTACIAATWFVVVALIVTDSIQAWHLILLALVTGCLRAFFSTTYTSLVYDIVGPRGAVAGMAWSSVVSYSSGIVGAVLAGTITARAGSAGAYLASGASFLVSLVLLFFVRESGQAAPRRTASVRENVRGAMRVLRTNRVLLGLTLFTGTGPFEMKEWVKDDHALLEAVPDHWRKTPSIKTAKILAVPEPAAQVAMFETGELQILRPELKDVPSLLEKGGVTVLVMRTHLGIFMAGNYLEKVGARTGNVLEQPGFDPSLAWVGDPEGSGCDWDVLTKPVPDGVTTWEDQGELCDDMNDARLVRWAMSMCIDREAIGETIYLGFGSPAYVRPVSTDNSLHKDEWVIPFDCAAAKQLLEEAGYGSGFDAVMYVGDARTNQQVGEAIGGTWLAELGINMTFDRSLYQVIRPSYVDRSNKELVLDSGSGGGDVDWPMDWPKGSEDNSWFEGGTMKCGSIPFSAITYGEMLSEADQGERLEMAKDWFDHQHYWKWQPGVIETPVLDMYNGDYMTWPKESRTMVWWWTMPFPLEDIVLK